MFVKYDVDTPCQYISSYTARMKHSDPLSNEETVNKNANVNSRTRNVKYIRNNSTNIVRSIFKAAGIITEYSWMSIEHQYTNKCCRPCYLSNVPLGINNFDDIDMYRTKHVICKKTSKVGFSDATVRRIAEADKRQPDEDERWSKVWMRGEQQEESRESVIFRTDKSSARHYVAWSPLCTKLFLMQFEEETRFPKLWYYASTYLETLNQPELIEGRSQRSQSDK